MKRIFECSVCGAEVEIEADHFIPGVMGKFVVKENGKNVLHTFVDPTSDKLCDVCLADKLKTLEVLEEIY